MKRIRNTYLSELPFIKEHADQIYFKNEQDFWKEKYYRISEEDCLKLHENNELYVLEKDKQILGFFTLKLINQEIANFSMLTVIEKHQRKGYGNVMLNYIFDHSVEKGLKKISLELLCPKGWIHPQKKILQEWYSSRGFKYHSVCMFEDLYPSHKKYMKCKLIFKKYHKSI